MGTLGASLGTAPRKLQALHSACTLLCETMQVGFPMPLVLCHQHWSVGYNDDIY